MNKKYLILILLCMTQLVLFAAPQSDKEVEAIVGKHTITFNQPPTRIPVQYSVDAPLLGNGYTGVALSGTPDDFVMRFARNDFWRLKSAFNASYPLVLGKVVLSLPQLKGGSYEVQQRLLDAVTVARFGKDESAVRCEIYVAASEDVMVFRITNEGEAEVSGSLRLALPTEEEIVNNPPHEVSFPDVRESGQRSDNIQYISRAYTEDVDIATKAAVAMRLYGGNGGEFTLKKGQSLDMVCAFSSNFKSEGECLQSVISSVERCSQRKLKQVRKAHNRWWREYWERSYVSIPDKEIEFHYYRSLYGIASCSRDKDFPAPIFGTWITKELPWWLGDYHLNYNHMAPYYALYSANRIEQAEPYYAPLLAAQERGRYYSQQVAGVADGIMLPVGIGPLGIETTRYSPYIEQYRKGWITSGNMEAGGLFWGQKSNSAYAVSNLAMQFYHTWDEEFTRKVYPFVKGVATFWEGYLKYEDGRYVILNDAIHEGTVGNKNPLLSLGMVRMVFSTVRDMSILLGVDEHKREEWQTRCDLLSDYPLQERNGKTVFRYTEQGTAWWGDNTLGIQHIYPAGQIGMLSDEKLLKVALNTIDEMPRWKDNNGTNSLYPAAARVGYDAETILKHLHDYSLNTYPNGFQRGNPHGIENYSTVPNTINLMLCTGHQDLVRLFPVWPLNMDASFHNIRVEGAFLVSATLKGGEVGDVVVRSEKGRDLNMENPWGERAVVVKSSHRGKFIVKGPRISLPTRSGERLSFSPEQ